MLKRKERIDGVIHDKKDFEVSVRTIASEPKEWSKFIPYNEAAIKLIYNTKIIDGVKFKFRYTTLIINARHRQ